MAEQIATVDFFFDPACPYTWVTSRWLVEAAGQRGFQIHARPYCLKFKNEKNPHEMYAKTHEVGIRALRVFLAVDGQLGNEKAKAFYTEFGYARFPADLQADEPDLVALLEAAGIDPKFADAAADTSFDERLRSELAVATELAGDGVGSPIIAIPGFERGFFGPVITDLPSDENIGKLWDAVVTMFALPELREFKRDNGEFPVAPARQ
jgi:2-hydroxychromene-2-carboxylate isomerase